MMIFGFLLQNVKTKAVPVALSIAWRGSSVEPQEGEARAREDLARFRRELYRCSLRRAPMSCSSSPMPCCAPMGRCGP